MTTNDAMSAAGGTIPCTVGYRGVRDSLLTKGLVK
jgi:hypothetical protein